jgi:hypothetical protein
MSRHTKAHTFTSHTSHETDQSLQKSVLFPDPRRNSNVFFPTLRCNIFFANAQPSTDKQPDSLLQILTGQCNLIQTTEARTVNMGFASGGVIPFRSSWDWQYILGAWCKSQAD